VLISKAFQNTEEWCFSFWNIFFRFRDWHFFMMQTRSVMTSYCLQIQWNPDLTNLQGKRKLLRKIGEFEKSGVELQRSTEEWKLLLVRVIRLSTVLNKRYLRKYWGSVLETWHHKCAPQNKQNDTLSAVAMTTVLPLMPC